MKEMKKFDLGSQTYAAPRAESVAMSNGGLLCASLSDLDGCLIQSFENDDTDGSWVTSQP